MNEGWMYLTNELLGRNGELINDKVTVQLVLPSLSNRASTCRPFEVPTSPVIFALFVHTLCLQSTKTFS